MAKEGTSIELLQMDVVLPPPIYKNCITTNDEKVGRTIGKVKSIWRRGDGSVAVESVEGIKYVVSPASIQFYQEG